MALNIPCPPVAQYREAPTDQPGSEQQNCKYCEKPMWVSQKKRDIIARYKESELNVRCYNCMLDWAHKNRDEFMAARQMKI